MNFEKTERLKTIKFDVDFSTEVKQMKLTTISSHSGFDRTCVRGSFQHIKYRDEDTFQTSQYITSALKPHEMKSFHGYVVFYFSLAFFQISEAASWRDLVSGLKLYFGSI